MYTVVPGRTGALAVRIETTIAPVSKSAKKQVALKTVAPKPARVHVSERKVIMHKPYVGSCKSAHKEMGNPPPKFKTSYEVGQERRKCQHSHFGRRGRRAIEIFC